MLLYLYNLLENLIWKLCEEFAGLDRRNLTNAKWVTLMVITTGLIGGCFYFLGQLSNQFCHFFRQLFQWKNVGLIGLVEMLFSSFTDVKLSLLILIGLLAIYLLIFNRYINRHNGNFADVFADLRMYLDADDDDDAVGDNLHANLNRNDAQNVHNGGITRHVIDSIKKITEKEKQNGVEPMTTMATYTEIRQYLMQSPKETSGQALDVLDHMHNFNDRHTASGLNEMEILRMVWQRIKYPINTSRVDDLKESLLLQMADCKPNNTLMCITGRISRIVQSLECIDMENLVDLKPLWAIKDQIAEYFSRYSDKLLNRVPAHYREAYEATERTPHQVELVKKFTECLKLNLGLKFKAMYLDTGILTSKELCELSKNFYDFLDQSE
jgi:hypothetical protein